MQSDLDAALSAELESLRQARTYKYFWTICSPQDAVAHVEGRGEVLVLSSNNYLGLANHPAVVEAGIKGLRTFGAGTASVRFICGTFAPHLELERALAAFLYTDAATTYVSCWNANEALIPSLTDQDTAIVSDELNHASIIDAIRLSRPAQKFVYRHSDMDDLAKCLASCGDRARKLVITDGVFSMEGDLARLPEIVELTTEHNAVLVVDDSHGIGVVGATGRGVAEHFDLLGKIDVITGTLGKALGGAAGGFVASTRAVCEILEQRSRPQLFSNGLPPTVACSAHAALDVLETTPSLVTKLQANAAYFRARIADAGFRPLAGESAIVPIIVGETAVAIELSERLLDAGVFVTGFGFPVVPEGTARLRAQISAAHTKDHLDAAVAAFERVRAHVAA